MCMKSFRIPWLGILLALVTVSPSVFAHGERALEPFVRMRTIQWYDI
jgi:methane/ammonia monooxygenase subunit B